MNSLQNEKATLYKTNDKKNVPSQMKTKEQKKHS